MPRARVRAGHIRGEKRRARARVAVGRQPRVARGRRAHVRPLQGRADGRSRARGGVRAAQTPEGIGVPIMMLVVPVVSAFE